MAKPWSVEDYKRWVRMRPKDASEWHRSDCVEADNLIRHTTLYNFNQWAKKEIKDAHARAFMELMVRSHFGSAEVDQLMTKLNCYPEWMEIGHV